MSRAVADSYAILAFLQQGPGFEAVLTLFEKAGTKDEKVLISAPNWAEVRYQVERKIGSDRWNEVRLKLLGLPLEIIPAEEELAEVAGHLKATRKMSLADCFAAALAMKWKAELYTGDPEFREVESEVKIVWI